MRLPGASRTATAWPRGARASKARKRRSRASRPATSRSSWRQPAIPAPTTWRNSGSARVVRDQWSIQISPTISRRGSPCSGRSTRPAVLTHWSVRPQPRPRRYRPKSIRLAPTCDSRWCARTGPRRPLAKRCACSKNQPLAPMRNCAHLRKCTTGSPTCRPDWR